MNEDPLGIHKDRQEIAEATVLISHYKIEARQHAMSVLDRTKSYKASGNILFDEVDGQSPYLARVELRLSGDPNYVDPIRTLDIRLNGPGRRKAEKKVLGVLKSRHLDISDISL